MVPDEQPPAAPAQTDSQAGKSPRRRSRRGGRRHSRRREPQPEESAPQPPSGISPASEKEDENPDQLENGPMGLNSPAEPVNPKATPERRTPSGHSKDLQRDRETKPNHNDPIPDRNRGPRVRSIAKAIEQVNDIIAELKHALEEMDDVLETLELAERQKIDDEREIESLQRALRRLSRPRIDDQSPH